LDGKLRLGYVILDVYMSSQHAIGGTLFKPPGGEVEGDRGRGFMTGTRSATTWRRWRRHDKWLV